MSLWETLDRTARSHPSSPAVSCGEISYDYDELARRSRTLAATLSDLGIGKGDRVAILHRNCHRFLETYYACAYLGAVLVPLNIRLSPEDFRYILEDSASRLLICQLEFYDTISGIRDGTGKLERIIWTDVPPDFQGGSVDLSYDRLVDGGVEAWPEPAPVDPADPAQLYYTSGTTGRPKGVVLTHCNNSTHAEWAIRELEIRGSDRWLHVSPMFHLADAWAVWAITRVGGLHVMDPEFRPESALALIEAKRVTLSNFIPTMLNLMVNHPAIGRHDLSSLRVVLSGGASIAPETVRKVMDRFGCNFIQTYGMTETSPFLTVSILKPHLRNLPMEVRFRFMVTTGRPFGEIELKVLDDDWQEVEPDGESVGEIWVRGPTVTPGYWNRPDLTSEKIVKGGWLRTGDMAVMNSEGYVTIVDRMDDVIITGGENVYSIEVENVLYIHPDVLEAAVVGIPDDTWGEAVCAAVVPRAGRNIDENAIRDHCREMLASFKVPKNVAFLDALPKTGSGKISKKDLRSQLC